MTQFDYSSIPDGYYDEIFKHGNPIRRAWHIQKFERVIDALPAGGSNAAILDIGCFSGTFLSLIRPEHFGRQLGVDILENQIHYANTRYATPYRRFELIQDIHALSHLSGPFDCVTLIEVIEHLTADEIYNLFTKITAILKPGGCLVLSTPNYASTWPIVELALNRLSDVTYQEQHITRFNYFGFSKKLRTIFPPLLDKFRVDFVTTTHLISPFLAWMSVKGACAVSRLVPHNKWKMPFGNLIVARLTRDSSKRVRCEEGSEVRP